jgi:Serine carboxypeptidase
MNACSVRERRSPFFSPRLLRCATTRTQHEYTTMYLILFLLSYLLSVTLAQYPPVSDLTTISSPFDANITISYKSPGTNACQTAFDTQQQYTGWVHIPGKYPTNTFFWFFGARQPTEALTIWLNGGPGASSMIGLFTENGPCEVVELAAGKLGTVVRDWGWDRGSNLLYIDQVGRLFALHEARPLFGILLLRIYNSKPCRGKFLQRGLQSAKAEIFNQVGQDICFPTFIQCSFC